MPVAGRPLMRVSANTKNNDIRQCLAGQTCSHRAREGTERNSSEVLHMSQARILARNSELELEDQNYSSNPLDDRDTDLYRGEYVMSFVEKWDELIDWDARVESEGDFFIRELKKRGAKKVLDVATGTGFHSVRLIEAGFEVCSVDGSAEMLAKAFENGQKRGLILKTVQADWRWLNRDIKGKYDAIVCLGNSFTHLYKESDRRRALAEYYAALKHDGILILDQRNYDAMLDHGFSTKHKYYYCGDQVTAQPDHIDEGLVRMRYSFPDGSDFHLNMCPIRKNYIRRLLNEAGFERVRTYGDFQESYQEDQPDFFIHVAEKSSLHLVRWNEDDDGTGIQSVTEDYYDSDDADLFYSTIWGGEDLHIGNYSETKVIREASDRIVYDMLGKLDGALGPDTRILDMGAGYGGAMRKVVKETGARAVCLNISETQNDYNRAKIRKAGQADKITVRHGVFEDVPEKDESFDAVWSQDSFLHSDAREGVLREAWRVLKPGGIFIFTDPCQADDVPEGVLQPVYDRLKLNSLGSFGFYRDAARAIGFEVVEQEERTHHLRTHYARVLEELQANEELLRDNGLLTEDDLQDTPDLPADHVDYGQAIPLKKDLLTRAYERFDDNPPAGTVEAFSAFCAEHSDWLTDYALYMALKDDHGGAPWTDWDTALVQRDPEALRDARATYERAIRKHQFWQFLFDRQWRNLRDYCHERDIQFFGDVPIYVAEDSADVWANQDLFHLDDHGRPTVVAGVPPDFFAEDGQRWGNPIYQWERMQERGFRWWTRRLQQLFRWVDIVRIDHFRGFAAYWEIPASEPTAKHGQWVEGPGEALFDAIEDKLGHMPIVAEDLGIITQDVTDLRDAFDFPGMAVLHFAFYDDPSSEYLPHNYDRNLVAYTGTHDNDTTLGWWNADLDEEQKDFARDYLDLDDPSDEALCWSCIRALMASVADRVVIPMQDVLALGTEARMNHPGNGGDNWTWRLTDDQLDDAPTDRLATLAHVYGRTAD